jgi:hypothetical protein
MSEAAREARRRSTISMWMRGGPRSGRLWRRAAQQAKKPVPTSAAQIS